MPCVQVHILPLEFGSSPGSLVFNRDMFLNIPLIADWHAVIKRQEHLVNENLMHENQVRNVAGMIMPLTNEY